MGYTHSRLARKGEMTDYPHGRNASPRCPPRLGRVNEKFRNLAMPYATVKDKVDEISPQYREELLAFLDFLIFRQNHSTLSQDGSSHVSSDSPRRHAGGITGEFYMAPDFDEPLECFKEYM